MKKNIFLICTTFLFISWATFAQTGSVKGKVLDGSFPLPGAIVQLDGIQKSASTDFEGNFTITGVAAGNYAITISYIGYEKSHQNIIVELGKLTQVPNIYMKSTSDELAEVVVSASVSRRLSEAKALNIQKKCN